jgi:RNA recognition motif-containing protein
MSARSPERSFKSYSPQDSKSPQKAPITPLFIGNIPTDLEYEELLGMMKKFGPLKLHIKGQYGFANF